MRVFLYAVVGLFLASRIYVLFFATILGSTQLSSNMQYAFTFQHAADTSVPFYAEITKSRRQFDARPEFVGPPPQPVEYVVEYPPLAIAWMVAPGFFVDSEPVKSSVLVSRGLSAIMDLVGLVLLILALPKFCPGEGALGESMRVLLYLVGGLILYHLLYDRLDLPVGVLLLAAVWLLVGRVHYAASFAVMALAINYKLTPGILLPIWVVGAMPAAALTGRIDRARLAASAAVRAACLGGMTAAIFLPFYWLWGRDTLDFLQYHARRGLQLESVWATAVLLVGRLTGSQPNVVTNFGAYHLASKASSMLAAASTWVTLALLALASISFWLAMRRRLSTVAPGSMTVAQAAPDLIVGYTILFMLVAMASAKVLSPQYFIWLVPLMPLVKWDSKPIKAILTGYLLMLALTTAIFPYFYFNQISRPLLLDQEYMRLPPTAFGLALLLARNGLLVALTAGVWLWLRPRRTAALN